MPVFNNPYFKVAHDNLLKMFAPVQMNSSDFANKALADARIAEMNRLGWLFDNPDDPTASRRSALTGVQGYGQTPEGFRYNVDQGNLTQRYGYDTQAATSRANNAADNVRALEERRMQEAAALERLGITDATQRYGIDTQAETSRQNNILDNQQSVIGKLFGPLDPGQIRPDVPVDIMEVLGLPGVAAVEGAPKPLTEGEVKGSIIQEMDPDLQAAIAFGNTPIDPVMTPNGPRNVLRPNAVDQQPAPAGTGTGTGYIAPDGSRGTTKDGITDAHSGKPLPQGTMPVRTQGTPEQTGLTTGTRSRVEQGEIAAQKFQNLLGLTRELADDPTNFGIPGFVKGTLQDVAAMANGVSSALGFRSAEEALQSAQVDLVRSGIDPRLLPGVFDPNLAALQTTSDLLVYQAAAALAGQSGRDVSDRDVQVFRAVVGDPREWTATPERFKAKLDQMERILNAMRTVDQNALGGNLRAGPGVPAEAAPPASGTTRLRFDENGNPL